MAKLDRKTQKRFALNASNNGQFGSGKAGTKVTSSDLAVLQNLSAYLNGLLDSVIIVDGEITPVLEEIQALHYIETTQLAYLFENGIPEYDSGTTYYQKSIVRKIGTYELYGSLIDNNTNNALPSAVSDSNWFYLGNLEFLLGQLITDYTLVSTLGNSGQIQAGHIFEKDEMGTGTDLALYLFKSSIDLLTDECATFPLTNGGGCVIADGTSNKKNIFGEAKGVYADGGATSVLSSLTLLDGVNNNFLLSCYLWPDDGQPAASQFLFIRYNDANNYWYLRLNTSGDLTFYSIQNGAPVTISTPVIFSNGPQSSPVFVQIYKTSALGMAIFVNRKLQAIAMETDARNPYTTTTGAFYIFSDNAGLNRYTGTLDMLRVQNRTPVNYDLELEACSVYTVPSNMQSKDYNVYGLLKDSNNIEKNISSDGMFLKKSSTKLWQYGFLKNILSTDRIKLYGGF